MQCNSKKENYDMNNLGRTLTATLLGIGLASTGAIGLALAQDRPTVVVTTGYIADAVSAVAGDRVDVTALMGPGVDPHLYRQTRSDVAALTNADAVFWHGLYLEAQLEDLFHQLEETHTVVALADAIPVENLLASEDYDGRYDPHVWGSPVLWKVVVEAALENLIALDPEGEAEFRVNAEAHLAEIDAIDAYAAEALATVPEGARVLVTAHDAFAYFGGGYGYEVLGIQGISTESEAGLREIEDLVNLLVERGIAAVFVESSVSDRNIQALIEGAAAQGHTVTIGGELFSDAMGDPGTYEGTYIGSIDHNVTTITRALGGTAPEAGLNGQLAGE
jgi:manganese/zinc/iron transport system substrate-binding protein